eukprot:6214127-Pleurochrysis_carterae.AAC.1
MADAFDTALPSSPAAAAWAEATATTELQGPDGSKCQVSRRLSVAPPVAAAGMGMGMIFRRAQ